MAWLLLLVAILELAGGFLVLFEARTDSDEIIGLVAIGFSFLTLGLAALVDTANRIRRRIDLHVARSWRDERAPEGPAAEPRRPSRFWGRKKHRRPVTRRDPVGF